MALTAGWAIPGSPPIRAINFWEAHKRFLSVSPSHSACWHRLSGRTKGKFSGVHSLRTASRCDAARMSNNRAFAPVISPQPVEHDAVSAFIDCNSDLRFIPSDLFRLAGSSDVSARCVVLGDDKGEQTVRRQASVSQLASMRRDRPVEHTADVVGMAAVKIKDAFSHPIRRFI